MILYNCREEENDRKQQRKEDGETRGVCDLGARAGVGAGDTGNKEGAAKRGRIRFHVI